MPLHTRAAAGRHHQGPTADIIAATMTDLRHSQLNAAVAAGCGGRAGRPAIRGSVQPVACWALAQPPVRCREAQRQWVSVHCCLHLRLPRLPLQGPWQPAATAAFAHSGISCFGDARLACFADVWSRLHWRLLHAVTTASPPPAAQVARSAVGCLLCIGRWRQIRERSCSSGGQVLGGRHKLGHCGQHDTWPLHTQHYNANEVPGIAVLTW